MTDWPLGESLPPWGAARRRSTLGYTATTRAGQRGSNTGEREGESLPFAPHEAERVREILREKTPRDLGGPGATWTIKKVVALVVLSGLGKAEASYDSVYRLVRGLGFRWKRGVKRLSRKDPHARAAFAPTIQRLADEANRGERTLIYVDEAHIHCDLDEGYGWAWGGEPYEIPSSSPPLRNKVSLYGAFVFNDPEVVLWKAPRCNSMFTLAYLFHLKKILGGAPRPTIVWDGAPWHKTRWLLGIAQRVLGFEIVRLPAYSPDFMPVEALWRWLREEVTRNQCHDTVEELVADVIEFGLRLNADPLGLITRLWPKLELHEDELPQDESLPLPALIEGGWEPPLPAAIEEAIGENRSANQALLRLTEKQWALIQLVLPEHEDRRGAPRDRRALVEAALWREETGASWRQLPDAYGHYETVRRSLDEWKASGVWEVVLGVFKVIPRAPPVAA